MKWCIVSPLSPDGLIPKALEIQSTVFHEYEVVDYKNILNNQTIMVRSGAFVLNYKKNIKEILPHEMYFAGDIIGPVSRRLLQEQLELKTIETSSLCIFNNNLLEMHVDVYIKSLKKQLEFSQDSQHYNRMLLLQRNPVKRLALFLLTIVDKKKLSPHNNIEIKINLSRLEIGFYLGLAEETVVRALRQLSQLALITVSTKNFIISNYQNLLDFFFENT